MLEKPHLYAKAAAEPSLKMVVTMMSSQKWKTAILMHESLTMRAVKMLKRKLLPGKTWIRQDPRRKTVSFDFCIKVRIVTNIC
jgi:hypothetical protein